MDGGGKVTGKESLNKHGAGGLMLLEHMSHMIVEDQDSGCLTLTEVGRQRLEHGKVFIPEAQV